MRKWLGEAVGSEAEDLSRHDKWLCMMYPRLSLLRDLLRDDGTIFISIDDNEYSYLLCIMDEIFGRGNFVGTIVWKNVTDNNPTNISVEHEYVMCYAKRKDLLPPVWKSATLPVKDRLIEVGSDFINRYPDIQKRQETYTEWFRKNKSFLWPFDRYKYIDDGGIYTGSQSVHNPGKEGYRYDVLHPNGKPSTQPLMGYRFPWDSMQKLLNEKRILFGEDETKIVELKVYVQDYRSKLSSLFELDGRVGTNELKNIFPESKRPFDFPKPTALIEEILSFTTQGDDIVLDSFAGSGTTGHAVWKLNQQDRGSRRFILIEIDAQVARKITAERLKRVKASQSDSQLNLLDNEVPTPSFRYCHLDDPLFDEHGQIREVVTFSDLAHHIYFSETGVPLPKAVDGQRPLIGTANDVAYYLLWAGRGSVNVLDSVTLAKFKHAGPKVVYADKCRLTDSQLRRANVVFRQIPYSIKVN